MPARLAWRLARKVEATALLDDARSNAGISGTGSLASVLLSDLLADKC